MNESNELHDLLAAATRDIPPGVDLLARFRPRRRARRVLIPATASLAVLTAVGLTTALTTQEPSAQAAVAKATTTTSSQSFHVFSTVGLGGTTITMTGAFDPAHGVGEWTDSDGGETRYIGDTIYLSENGNAHWLEVRHGTRVVWEPLQLGALGVGGVGGNPQVLFTELKSATHITADGTASGTGWSGRRYRFTGTVRPKLVVLKLRPSASPGTKNHAWAASTSTVLTGTVEVDGQGRVRVIDLTERIRFPAGLGVTGDTIHTTEVFSDYGAHVSVTAPPADRVRAIPTAPPKPKIPPSPTPPAG